MALHFFLLLEQFTSYAPRIPLTGGTVVMCDDDAFMALVLNITTYSTVQSTWHPGVLYHIEKVAKFIIYILWHLVLSRLSSDWPRKYRKYRK